MDVSLIEVPYMIGDDRQGGSAGPRRLVEAGAGDLLATKGMAVSVEHVERTTPFRDSASASLAVNRELAATVHRALETGGFPLVLAGSCDACLGILAGFEHSRCGVVWFDAHGDFNTPESTQSGFFAGMSAAVVVGHCYRSFWAQMGDATPIREEAVLMLGIRDLSPAEERERLERSPIEVVGWRAGEPRKDVTAALDELAGRVHEIYLHVDLDALSPEAAPGVVDTPVPGGLSLRQLEEAIQAVANRFRIRAAALTTFNPERDENDETLRASLRILELIAESVATRAASDSATTSNTT